MKLALFLKYSLAKVVTLLLKMNPKFSLPQNTFWPSLLEISLLVWKRIETKMTPPTTTIDNPSSIGLT